MIYFLAMREYLSGIRALLDTTGGRLAADVRPVAYERLLGRMTKDFWWRRAEESYWILARHGWSPRRREVPRALGSLREWRARLRRIPAVFSRYPADRRGIRLHQAMPGRVIRQVRRVTGMRLVERSPTRSARLYPWPMVTAFSAWPSFVFVKP